MSVSGVVTVTGEPLAGVMVQVSVPAISRALVAAVLRTAPYMTRPGSGMPAANATVVANKLKAARRTVNFGIMAFIFIICVWFGNSVMVVCFQNLRYAGGEQQSTQVACWLNLSFVR